jgi:ribonuclease P protein component
MSLFFMTDYSLNRSKKLKSKIIFDKLFSEGVKIHSYPILIYMEKSESTKVAFTASKRSFRSAVDRNHIKRHLNEAFRLQMDQLNHPMHCTVIYISKTLDDTSLIGESMGKVFAKINNRDEKGD